MKKICKFVMAVVLVFGLLANVSIPMVNNVTEVQAATKVRLNKKKATIAVGDTLKLKVKGTKDKVTWTSSKKDVATVNGKGKVTAKNEGVAKITAKVGDEKYTCVVTVVQEYGSIEGNVTYLYNSYRGHVADVGAEVYLIPTSGAAKEMKLDSYGSWALGSKLKEYGIYRAKVDGFGEYSLQNVPVGEYRLVIISNETTSQGWFDDDAQYREDIASILEGYLASDASEQFAEYVGMSKFVFKDITIEKDKTTKYSFDFGITYI